MQVYREWDFLSSGASELETNEMGLRHKHQVNPIEPDLYDYDVTNLNKSMQPGHSQEESGRILLVAES